MGDEQRAGVQFRGGRGGAALLYRQLRGQAERDPAAYAGALPEELRPFRRGYGEALVRFEAARAAHPQRGQHAVALAAATAADMAFVDDAGERPLAEALAGASPLVLEHRRFAGAGGLAPALPEPVPAEGPGSFDAATGRLLADGRLTAAAARALGWICERARREGGEIDLRGTSFAILGAAAELAPTLLLLEAGARVLWIDRVPPPEGLEKQSELSGELWWAPEGADLLARPGEIAATLEAFAGTGPLHLGLYAYAPGAAREWRLTHAMNAIARAVASRLASVSLLVSPTTPVVLEPEDREASTRRRERRPAWQAALDRLARFPAGAVEHGPAAVARSIVSIQGASYQAAQYLGKRITAEAWLAEGIEGQRVTVSANVAPISRTRSLSHPVFEAAFGGARAFGVETYPPPFTRSLMGWLMLHDLLNPEAPGAAAPVAERAPLAGAQQVHGGLLSLPYALDPALRFAAIIGFARRPGLAMRLLRR